MMRSMFSGVSGLKSHQVKMDVISNNIANVNTIGFKSGRVTFQEVFNQTLRMGGAPDSKTGRGGMNPMQIGLGMGVGAVDMLMTRGGVQRTDNPTDVSIDGEGFFIVKGSDAEPYKFTRAGNFGIDKLGNLVTGSGYCVYGWVDYTRNEDGTYEFDTEKPMVALNLYNDETNKNKRVIASKPTTEIGLSGNLDSAKNALGTAINTIDVNETVTLPDGSTVTQKKTPHFKVPVTVYDNLGNAYELDVNFYKCYTDTTGTSPETSWYWEVSTGTGMSSSASGFVKFDSYGQIIDDPAFSTTPQITLTPDAATTGTSPFDVKIDFKNLTMYSAQSSVKPARVDGYPSGNLVTFSIGSDGILTGVYSNGQQQPLGMIAVATFENPAGLQKCGENLFIPTPNSGDFKKGVKPGSEGSGVLSSGTLEMSNVDLSKEFTEMIITQRGFQANSRIITASDEMLQDLVNLKR